MKPLTTFLLFAAALLPAMSQYIPGAAATAASPTTLNGTTVPTNSAANQLLRTTATGTGGWADITNCTAGLTYDTTAHTFGCAGSPTTINGTSVPTNSAADQVLRTTASATGGWTNIGACATALTYDTSAHTFGCAAAATGTLGAYTTADFSRASSTTLADVTGLSVTLVAGHVYEMDFLLNCTFGTGGFKYELTGTATVSDNSFSMFSVQSANPATLGQAASNNAPWGAAISTTGLPSGSGQIRIRGFVKVTGSGTVKLQVAQQTGSGTLIISAFSSMSCVDITSQS